MADARIQDLDPVNQVQDNDNFVLEQNKKAHRLTGAKLIRYLITACDKLGILGVHVGPDEPKENQNVWIEEVENYEVPDESFALFDSRYEKKGEFHSDPELDPNSTRPIQNKPVALAIADTNESVSEIGSVLQIRPAESKNAINSDFMVGQTLTREIVESWYVDTPTKAKLHFTIEPVFDFSDGQSCTTSLYFNDGTFVKDVPGMAVWYYRDDVQITYFQLGNPSKYDDNVNGANTIYITANISAPDNMARFYGKTIAGWQFALTENSGAFHPFVSGKQSGELESIKSDVRSNTSRIISLENQEGHDITPEAETFIGKYANATMNAGKDTTELLFFTDPHPWSVDSPTLFYDEKEALSVLSSIYNNGAFECLVCGGDWINWGPDLSLPTANEELVRTHGMMEKLAKVYRPAVGNHEYAFYDSTTSGILTEVQIRNAYMPEYPELYYSYETSHHKIITLNTGVDPNATLPEQQLEFLKSELLSAKSDIVVVCHIVYDGATSSTAKIAPVYQSILNVLDNYNNRVSPYASSTQTVLCTLAGHMHEYMTHVSSTGIVSIAFDKFVSNSDKKTHIYGVTIDSTHHKLTVVQTNGENLIYNLPII